MSEPTPSESGTYTLIVELQEPRDIRIGNLGLFHFPDGFYSYTGSALGKSQNLKVRVMRHLRSEKSHHWHIDHLLTASRVRAIVFCLSGERLECLVSQALEYDEATIVVARGFGASDCRRGCKAHLFYHSGLSLAALVDKVRVAYSSLHCDAQTLQI